MQFALLRQRQAQLQHLLVAVPVDLQTASAEQQASSIHTPLQ
jgi:hypothetical protein